MGARRLLAFGLALLALTACGGGDDGDGGNNAATKEEYQRALAEALLPLGEQINALGTARTAADAGVKAERIVATLRNGADKLDRVVPPEEIAEPHKQLVAATREYADEVEMKLEQGAQAKPAGVAFDEYFLSSEALAALNQAAREIRDAGYQPQAG